MIDVLLFVEDPGAANYLAPLPGALEARYLTACIIATGAAIEYLEDRKVPFVQASSLDPEGPLEPFTPKVVVVGTAENPDTFGLRMIEDAKRRGILTVGAVDAPGNEAYRFRGRRGTSLAYSPDWLVVPESSTGDSYEEIGYPRARIFVAGHPHFDSVRQAAIGKDDRPRGDLRNALFPNLDNMRKVLAFATEPDSGSDPADFTFSSSYTIQGRGVSSTRCKVVLEEFLDAVSTLEERPYLVLRLHPRSNPEDFRIYSDEIDLVSKGGVSLDLLNSVDAIVGMTSMILMEATLLGKPTLSIVPRIAEKRWLPTIGLGLTNCACTRSEIEEAMPKLIAGQDVPDPSLIDRFLPSGAVERVADFISSISNSR